MDVTDHPPPSVRPSTAQLPNALRAPARTAATTDPNASLDLGDTILHHLSRPTSSVGGTGGSLPTLVSAEQPASPDPAVQTDAQIMALVLQEEARAATTSPPGSAGPVGAAFMAPPARAITVVFLALVSVATTTGIILLLWDLRSVVRVWSRGFSWMQAMAHVYTHRTSHMRSVGWNWTKFRALVAIFVKDLPTLLVLSSNLGPRDANLPTLLRIPIVNRDVTFSVLCVADAAADAPGVSPTTACNPHLCAGQPVASLPSLTACSGPPKLPGTITFPLPDARTATYVGDVPCTPPVDMDRRRVPDSAWAASLVPTANVMQSPYRAQVLKRDPHDAVAMPLGYARKYPEMWANRYVASDLVRARDRCARTWVMPMRDASTGDKYLVSVEIKQVEVVRGPLSCSFNGWGLPPARRGAR
ncbi:hypothetical protein AMAG_05821 [Allomyces macrogynus ATCC 38327]|uniref:Uncharacterized protein n=1 Tax=Allomyces macrogynus (strain ATCC 38327) TaxID=578462 RepID=A0A0L0SD15_ALLM3|nr:hypothetical protein AMAG_05821 [Allomyces macrogynus ATCC 38327]|eukprot:KNE60433.1 hypothetical protein AMAG_05821 [Allomyces macrogynus ATCC 38327]